MDSQYVHFSDIKINIGDYVFSLNYVGYDTPRKWDIKNHSHRNYELHTISEGIGTLSVGEPVNDVYDIIPGSLYLTGPGVIHCQQSGNENMMNEYGLRFDIEYRPYAGSDKRDNILAKSFIESPFFFFGTSSGDWHLKIEEMLREAHMQLPGFKKKLTGLFMQFIVELGRLSCEISGSDNDPPPLQAVGGIDIKARLDTYFWGFGGLQPSDRIINDLHLTRRNFTRLMQKYYGMTYTEKANRLKIGYSKELMDSGVLLCEVWQKSGFKSWQYFCRVFKNITGQTPTEYSKGGQN